MSSGPETSDLAARLDALASAADLAEGRAPADAVAGARACVTRGRERARLSSAHTVVALAGATGSGKSSLYNALAGLDLSVVGVQRPTTSATHACVWEPDGAGPLLDRLGVPPRQRRTHDSELDLHPDDDLVGLVLLDLPDHDSVRTEHRAEVDRVTRDADVVVWVTDPEKYADAAAHERYLRPLADADAVTVVVLNQVDRLSPGDAEACLGDLRRLVVEGGLKEASVVATSAADGAGVDALRSALAAQVAGRRSALRRLGADVDAAVQRLGADTVVPRPGADHADEGQAGASRAERLDDALAAAAGVAALADTVGDARREEGWRTTAWPPSRVRASRRREAAGRRDDDGGRAEARGVPPAASRPAVAHAVRGVVEEARASLPSGWAEAAAARVTPPEDVAAALDTAVSETDLAPGPHPRSWRSRRLGQGVCAGLAVLGVLALAGGGVVLLAGAAPEALSATLLLLVPLLVTVLGVGAGLALAATAPGVVDAEAARRRDAAEEDLRRSVADVASRHVHRPLEEERSRLARFREACAAARGA